MRGIFFGLMFWSIACGVKTPPIAPLVIVPQSQKNNKASPLPKPSQTGDFQN